ncbi:AI-2E family transporter [Cellulomonas fengjieae]|uniref:AI-2E family transporter n=1 Tax=Cellulomonas fengjieae TaxID=2819978 RepID=UPI001AAF0A5C|nr:AI-2E family transporter [Cellulomonas fengjieae]MBO3100500.1 AI-2E family transporter [Cellulomonas fengjieae]
MSPTASRPRLDEPGRTGDGQAVPPAVRNAAAWSWRLLLIGAGLAVLLWLLNELKVVVVPIAVAVLLAVLLTPFVGWLQRVTRMPRAAAAGIGLFGMLALVAGLLTLAGRSIIKGFGQLWQQAAQGIDRLTTWLADGPLQVSDADIASWTETLQGSLTGGTPTLVSGALHATTTVGHVAAGALIALFCTFFFLLDGRTIWAWVVGLFPRGSREYIHQAGRRGLVTLGAYTRTQILVAAVDAVGIGVGAAILQVPLALPLAVLVFLGSFIPIVGAVVTGSVAILVALVSNGPGSAIWMLAVVLLVQQFEGHVLQPFLMGHAVSLHPVAVLLSVAAGSFVAGIVGALFAVPVAATINTVILYLHGHDKFPQLGTDDHVPVRGRGHPILDRAIAQMAEARSERVATRAEAAERAEADAPAVIGTEAHDAGEPGGPDSRPATSDPR